MKHTFASLGRFESFGVRLGGAIADMIALGRCKVLVSSASTFSMWASFSGQTPTIWFSGQIRQELIIDEKLFNGEVDYNNPFPTSIIQLINND